MRYYQEEKKSMQRTNNKVIFISEMKNPSKDASSSQIMTKNILSCLRRNSDLLIFAPIIDSNIEVEVRTFYKNDCDSFLFLKGLTKNRRNPIKALISMFFQTFFRNNNKLYRPFEKIGLSDFIVVTHSPSIDAILYADVLKKKVKIKKYIQFWGDPISLGLICPEQFNFKRCFHKIIENKLHSKTDKLVFGTKSLYDGQIKLFPNIKNKSIWIDVPYSLPSYTHVIDYDDLKFGYFGNYYSNIRNILPMYEAFKNTDSNMVIFGSSNVALDETENIKIHDRVPQSVVKQEEQKIDVSICVLNKVGIQIPGKIFYETNINKVILVILDGPRKDCIMNELARSNRFVFCDNNKDSIRVAINEIRSTRKQFDPTELDFYNPQRIGEELLR